VTMMSSLSLSLGFHGLYFIGVIGIAGNSTEKFLRNGHVVFSNSKTWENTSLSSSVLRVSVLSSFGTSIRQYCGFLFFKMNFPVVSSTHQHLDFGSMA